MSCKGGAERALTLPSLLRLTIDLSTDLSTHHLQPAFPEDGGDLAIRGTVHGYAFTRP